MTDPYRKQALNGPEFKAPPMQHEGPRAECPACGNSYKSDSTGITTAKLCWFGKRRWFRVCEHPGYHLHQKCKQCGAEWVCDTKTNLEGT